VNAAPPALLALYSIADAEYGDDGLFSPAGEGKIVIAYGTAILITHQAANETARDVH
jgi:hypothetical protein